MHPSDQVFIAFNFPWLFGAFPLSPDYESDEEPVWDGAAALIPQSGLISYVDDLVVYYGPLDWHFFFE